MVDVCPSTTEDGGRGGRETRACASLRVQGARGGVHMEYCDPGVFARQRVSANMKPRDLGQSLDYFVRCPIVTVPFSSQPTPLKEFALHSAFVIY